MLRTGALYTDKSHVNPSNTFAPFEQVSQARLWSFCHWCINILIESQVTEALLSRQLVGHMEVAQLEKVASTQGKSVGSWLCHTLPVMPDMSRDVTDSLIFIWRKSDGEKNIIKTEY